MAKKCGRIFRCRKRRKLKAGTYSLPEKDRESYINFMQWLQKMGYKSQKNLKLAYFKDTGRGMMTCETIRPGDTFVSLSQSFLITPSTVMCSYLGTCMQSIPYILTALEILTIFLMCERSRGNLSPWQAYLNTLPTTYSTPAYFKESSLRKFPPDMYCLCLKQIELVKSSFAKLKTFFYSVESSLPELHGAFSFESFKWAWFTVNTRCVYIDCDKPECTKKDCGDHLALAPYLDFLNHSCHVKVTAGYNKSNECYEIKSHHYFKKHEQVFINYGEHDNRKLLLEYGFIIPQNPNDFIPISCDIITNAIMKIDHLSAISVKEKLVFLNQKKILRNIGCCRTGITWNLQTILQFLVSSSRSQLSGDLFNLHLKPEEHKLYEIAVNNVLLQKIHHYENLNLQTANGSCFENEKLVEVLCRQEQEIILNILSHKLYQ